jgi:hypothetical protein
MVLMAAAATAAAQDAGPIGPFVIDLRGSLAAYGQNPELAANRGFVASQLPSLGLGLDMGGHVYVFRWRAITFGLGASVLFSRNERGPSEDLFPERPPVKTRFTAASPQLSFNFGDGDGWSYLSGGLGTSRLSVFDASRDEPPQRRAKTLNYGGGARWFAKDHLAFTFDLRFYAISPLVQKDDQPGAPRMTLMVLNVGAAFK